MAFVLRLFQCKSSPLQFWIERNVTMSNSLFTLVIVVQLLLICASPELVMFAEKIGRHISSYKLNLGLAALVLILAAYIYFWAQFGAQMNSLGVNLALMLSQTGSLYVAFYSYRLREDDKSIAP